MYAQTLTLPLPSTPYITAAEYQQAPTGVDSASLVRNNAGASAAELANVIARASAWADRMCSQPLGAVADTESGRLYVSREGELRIHPRFTPLLDVTGISYGASPNALSAMTDVSNVWVESTQIIVPLSGGGFSFAGPIQFGPTLGSGRLFCSWSYIAGWPNTVLAATAAAGDTTLQVRDATGILPGRTQLTIYDGAQTEIVTAGSAYVQGTTTVTLAAPLRFAHSVVGVSVSALPPDVKQAVILLTSALIRTRGVGALVMGSVRGQPEKTQKGGQEGADDDIDLADELLGPFKRVR